MPLPVPFGVSEWECDYYTEADYFEWEEHSPVRWEFRPARRTDSSDLPLGVIHAMPGAEAEHSAFTVDVLTGPMNALDRAGEQGCRVFNCLMRFHTPDGRNTYPDISIVQGKAAHYQGRDDILTNPILLGEVLSPATEAYDRGDKWASYQAVPTLRYFLLLSVDRARVELYTREGGGWHYEAHEGFDAAIVLPDLSVSLALADLYAKMDFEEAGLCHSVDSPNRVY